MKLENAVLAGMTGSILLALSAIVCEVYKMSDEYKNRVARKRIKKGLPPYDDENGQFYFDFVRDYL